ncbi:hypothetical protein EFN43_02280 [Pediococcus pentosaceus]|uniref:hypothetical protein n=1 Tax=Pediococcus pentosaceus TaxID=1255 RepID=UPI0021A59758|nr:hypothetical protein [Pediococcus pentosaceus]MCT3019914.1 hypothetical protein [Pediococcus pentosaceus]
MRIPKFSDQEAENFFNHDYIDRGMIKWQGFYLSDHTSALNAEHETKNKVLQREVLPQITVKEITDIINKAIVKKKTVKIQTNKCDSNGIFEAPVVGKINGYIDDVLYVDWNLRIKINEIRNIKFEY